MKVKLERLSTGLIFWLCWCEILGGECEDRGSAPGGSGDGFDSRFYVPGPSSSVATITIIVRTEHARATFRQLAMTTGKYE